ncbi:MAG: DUF2179 domain-containing protein [Salinivirgaceae bacterium]|nr:DUF2179 domain-containing protein [Salinivirgaceae bacterium]MDD4745741.1 DUF2179 domain-containing protein [Salinivirgaceae bacterium]MDY0279282.1 DUF2179 domain-containing protein [Salinivirgaceae bacterium]
METFFDTFWFTYLVLPLLIFTARVFDVSIGTLRIIFISKGKKSIAPILGFFEVFIWIIAMGEIMKNLNNWSCYIGYAAGFATGNYIGMLIEEKLAIGVHIIRVITERDTTPLLKELHQHGYGATLVDAKGTYSKVSLVYVIIKRKELLKVENIIQSNNPNAFYTIEDIKQVKSGIFPATMMKRSRLTSSLTRLRKGK